MERSIAMPYPIWVAEILHSIMQTGRFELDGIEPVSMEVRIEIQRLKTEAARLRYEEVRRAFEAKQHKPTTGSDAATDYRFTQGRGPKVQAYTSDGTLVKTYVGALQATRDVAGASQSGIRNAIDNCTMYKGHRWAALDRSLPDDAVQEIGATATAAIEVNRGFVAMLNLTKTKVEKVFCDQKEAAEDRQFKGNAAICNAISRGSKSGGFYWKLWSDCSKELQDAYLANNSLPERRSGGRAVQVQQLDADTNEVIKTHACMQDVIKAISVTRATLLKAAADGVVLRGFKWRILQPDAA